MTTFKATKQRVSNRGAPPDDFLRQLVAWGRRAPAAIFVPNANHDIYSSVASVLGPWKSPLHRRAVMLEVMRVLGGFESSWHWNAGRDMHNRSSNTAVTTEAGLWQVSANSMNFGPELKQLVHAHAGKTDGVSFQAAMKRDHPLAMEYIARLLRRTTRHNGPVLRHEIDRWLRRDAVAEFQSLLHDAPAQPQPVNSFPIVGVWSCPGVGSFECRRDAQWGTLMIVSGYMQGWAVYAGGTGVYSCHQQSFCMTSNVAMDERNVNNVLIHKWKRVL